MHNENPDFVPTWTVQEMEVLALRFIEELEDETEEYSEAMSLIPVDYENLAVFSEMTRADLILLIDRLVNIAVEIQE